MIILSHLGRKSNNKRASILCLSYLYKSNINASNMKDCLTRKCPCSAWAQELTEWSRRLSQGMPRSRISQLRPGATLISSAPHSPQSSRLTWLPCCQDHLLQIGKLYSLSLNKFDREWELKRGFNCFKDCFAVKELCLLYRWDRGKNFTRSDIQFIIPFSLIYWNSSGKVNVKREM